MKLSSKLPTRNGLTESGLERDLLRAPTKSRWLIAEVVCGKIETTFDEFGDPYQVATAQVVAGEYITDTIDLPNLRMISRRAFDARRGEDTIPGVDHAPMPTARELVDAYEKAQEWAKGIDTETGEVLDEEEPQ